MRKPALLLLGFGLLLFESTCYYQWHIDSMKPNLLSSLLVFIVWNLELGEGAWLVFGLGFLQDSFAGVPVGMSSVQFLIVFVLLHFCNRFLLSHQLHIQMSIVFVASLLSMWFYVLLLLFLDSNIVEGWLIFKRSFPLALLETLLSFPVFYLARKILKPLNLSSLARAK